MKLDTASSDAPPSPRVVRVSACRLTATSDQWDYAVTNRTAIEDHWRREVSKNPSFYNGPVWLLSEWSVTDEGVFHGSFLRTEFRAYLYWRAQNFEPAGVWDAFGSGVVRAAGGEVLLGEQNPGNVNAGCSYPPSGFIDDRDVDQEHAINIDASVSREIYEEIGVDLAHFRRQPGYWVTLNDRQISIAVVFDSVLAAEQLSKIVVQNLDGQSRPELARVHMVSGIEDLGPLCVPQYTQRLLCALFGGVGSGSIGS